VPYVSSKEFHSFSADIMFGLSSIADTTKHLKGYVCPLTGMQQPTLACSDMAHCTYKLLPVQGVLTTVSEHHVRQLA
jgi:hypothetical protein